MYTTYMYTHVHVYTVHVYDVHYYSLKFNLEPGELLDGGGGSCEKVGWWGGE